MCDAKQEEAYLNVLRDYLAWTSDPAADGRDVWHRDAFLRRMEKTDIAYEEVGAALDWPEQV